MAWHTAGPGWPVRARQRNTALRRHRGRAYPRSRAPGTAGTAADRWGRYQPTDRRSCLPVPPHRRRRHAGAWGQIGAIVDRRVVGLATGKPDLAPLARRGITRGPVRHRRRRWRGQVAIGRQTYRNHVHRILLVEKSVGLLMRRKEQLAQLFGVGQLGITPGNRQRHLKLIVLADISHVEGHREAPGIIRDGLLAPPVLRLDEHLVDQTLHRGQKADRPVVRSNANRSVKVPPTSMPSIQLEAMHALDQRSRMTSKPSNCGGPRYSALWSPALAWASRKCCDLVHATKSPWLRHTV
jgi:hypothetical protein